MSTSGAEEPAARFMDVARQSGAMPRHGSLRVGRTRRWFARFLLWVGRWKSDEPPPDLDSYVIVAAPHTDWWDGFWMMASSWRWGVRVSWLVKTSSVSGFSGWLMRRMGAVPVERSTPQGLVDQLVSAFAERDALVLVIPPEGTRARREYWKSGFYHIAHRAGVPICLSYLDYTRKRLGLGSCLMPSGDIRQDMDLIREFYKDVRGKHPENFTPPRLRDEHDPDVPDVAAAALPDTDDTDDTGAR